MGEIIDVLQQAAVLIRKHRCAASGAPADRLDEALTNVLKALASMALVMALVRKPDPAYYLDAPV